MGDGTAGDGTAGDGESVAERYGRSPADPRRTRRLLIGAFAAFTALGVGFAGWVGLHQAGRTVTWTDQGFVGPPDDAHATVSVQVTLPAGASAVCTVRAVNAVQTEVGRADVVVGPSASGVVRLAVPLRTSELATAGGVKACVRR